MKYKFKYIEGLEPVTKSIQLTIGAVIHEAFDMFYKGFGDIEILKYINDAFDLEISKQEVADIEDLVIGKYIALGMWQFYPYKTLSDFQEIYSEEEVHIPIGNYELTIKVDGRIKKDDCWWIRELKTTTYSLRQFEQRMATSAQVTGYVYGMKKKGYDIKGVMFDYIKKPILRKNKMEDMYSFGTRIMKDYQDRFKLYYGRLYTYRTDTDLKLYEKDMLAIASEIEKRKASGEFFRNQDACYNFNSECPYLKVCRTEQPDNLTIQLYFVKGGGDARRV